MGGHHRRSKCPYRAFHILMVLIETGRALPREVTPPPRHRRGVQFHCSTGRYCEFSATAPIAERIRSPKPLILRSRIGKFPKWPNRELIQPNREPNLA